MRMARANPTPVAAEVMIDSKKPGGHARQGVARASRRGHRAENAMPRECQAVSDGAVLVCCEGIAFRSRPAVCLDSCRMR